MEIFLMDGWQECACVGGRIMKIEFFLLLLLLHLLGDDDAFLSSIEVLEQNYICYALASNRRQCSAVRHIHAQVPNKIPKAT